MKLKFILKALPLLLLSGPIFDRAEGATSVSRAKIPQEGRALRDFILHGWTIEREAKGDLNQDGREDAALILIEDRPAYDQGGAKNERWRDFIVVLGSQDGKFVLGGRNADLLQCDSCGGVKEGVGLEVKKGVVILTQTSGSREFTEETWRFRWDPRNQRFVLIGRDMESGDSMTGEGKVESVNCLTGVKLTETYRYDSKGEGKVTTGTKKVPASRSALLLEDVKSK